MVICNDKQRCTGCSACLSVCPRSAIRIVEDSHGFYRPTIDESKCVECGLCQATCPANGSTSNDLKMGPRRVLAYQASDAERAKSSSGAAFWTLATYVLDNGGIVYGACFDVLFRGVAPLLMMRRLVVALNTRRALLVLHLPKRITI